jgi:hypothetical protein
MANQKTLGCEYCSSVNICDIEITGICPIAYEKFKGIKKKEVKE